MASTLEELVNSIFRYLKVVICMSNEILLLTYKELLPQ